MLFTDEQVAGILDGSVRVTLRRWARPQARTGGRYRLRDRGFVVAEAVELIAPGQLSEDDARLAGFASRATALAFLEGRGAPFAPDERLTRIALRFDAGPDPRALLAADSALGDDDVVAIARRLAAMDARSDAGPWTSATLELIAAHPRRRASELAAVVERPVPEFKADVRRLKQLGLTISHRIGYELSPRGCSFLDASRRGRLPEGGPEARL